MSEEAVESDGNPLLWGAIGFIVVALIALGFLSTLPAFEGQNDPNQKFSISQTIPSGDLDVNSSVVNKKAVNVRQQVGGSSIGIQDKRERGILLEGPVGAFGSTWWMVDYKDAPDGWVEEKYITSNIGMFIFINIVPILYDNFIRPVGIFLSVIGVIIFIIIKNLHGRAAEVEAKQQALRKERALKHFQPELMEAKSVVDDTGDVPVNLPTGEDVPKTAPAGASKNDRWDRVEKLSSSRNESDWRQAILEADIILDDMVSRMGYEGDTLGEKMKQIEASDFLTLESAMEAHRIRNKVAHSGTMFNLTREETDRVINLYRRVFEEFYYI